MKTARPLNIQSFSKSLSLNVTDFSAVAQLKGNLRRSIKSTERNGKDGWADNIEGWGTFHCDVNMAYVVTEDSVYFLQTFKQRYPYC